ncbi:ABC transporter permease [Candidatus Zixiibacteriota bacterium]
MITPGYQEVLLSFLLVVGAIVITRLWKIPVAKDMALGSVRSFLQLVAVGYALNLIFDLESPYLIILAFIIMLTVGAQAGSSRVKNVKGSFVVTLLAMFIGSFLTLGLMLLFNIISFEARYIIPLGGMLIGNSMNASALCVDRLCSDIQGNQLAIETSLSLGKTWRMASSKFIKDASTTGMISILNFMKTVGIVALPGAMTGMIIAGIDPLKAVLLQIIVVYMLLMAVSLTSVIAVEFTVRKFFTHHHQLKQIC